MTLTGAAELSRWKRISEQQRDRLLAQAHAAKSMGEQSRYAVRARLVQIEIDKYAERLADATNAPAEGASTDKPGTN